ncbi:MAG: Yip1 family protein [Patescibacteria group bacterium]
MNQLSDQLMRSAEERNKLNKFEIFSSSFLVAFIVFLIIYTGGAFLLRGDFFGFNIGQAISFMFGAVVGLVLWIILFFILLLKEIKKNLFLRIFSIIGFCCFLLFGGFVAWRLFFGSYLGVPAIPAPELCSLSADKNLCLFNTYHDKLMATNDLKLCDELYDKYKLDLDYFAWPYDDWQITDEKDYYPNACMTAYQFWYYINQRNKMFNEKNNINDDCNICIGVEKMSGYSIDYPFNIARCFDDIKYYKGEDPSVCVELLKAKGYDYSTINKVKNYLEQKQKK